MINIEYITVCIHRKTKPDPEAITVILFVEYSLTRTRDKINSGLRRTTGVFFSELWFCILPVREPPPSSTLSWVFIYLSVIRFFPACSHSRHSWFDHVFTCRVQHWHFVMPGSVGRRSSYRLARWCTWPLWRPVVIVSAKINQRWLIYFMWNYQRLGYSWWLK